ncbi:MAG: sulfotransferase domain-containing protein [Chloroflexota bacterium]
MTDDNFVLAYFGHHKCGSTMILNIVTMTCKYLGLKHTHFHSPAMWGYDENGLMLDRVAQNLGLDFVSYISADIKYIGDARRFKGVHVIRDPRDIVVSSYFSNLYSHSVEYWPELKEFRSLLEKLPKDEGMLENIKFMAKLPVDGQDLNLFDTLKCWDYSLPNILEIKFEDLVRNPYQLFIEIFEFLGLVDDTELSVASIKSILRRILQTDYPKLRALKKISKVPAWMLFHFIYSNRFSKLAKGREKGQENVRSHYRKGVPGDWVNHFNDVHKKFFKENYNDILVKLGYEKDDRW